MTDQRGMGAMEEKRGRGRPRVYTDNQARVKAYRRKQEGHRLDGFVLSSASWRLKRLAEAWGCSLAGAVDRLALEADDRYQVILFPETE